LRDKSRRWARLGLISVAVGIALVSLATPLVSETVREKWFSYPRVFGLMLLPAATFAAGVWVWMTTGRENSGSDWKPFAGAAAIFILAFVGLAYSLFPFIVIDRLTVWDAAAHRSALVFVLIGVLIVLPFLLAYTAYAHRVFRGKVTGALYE
jgi:cytochrome d ubiquinol oxidase subunit II